MWGVGQIVGSIIVIYLVGSLVAWTLRKATTLDLMSSYAVGVAIITLAAPALYAASKSVSYLDAFGPYAIGGVLAFLIIYALAARKHKSIQHNRSDVRTR